MPDGFIYSGDEFGADAEIGLPAGGGAEIGTKVRIASSAPGAITPTIVIIEQPDRNKRGGGPYGPDWGDGFDRKWRAPLVSKNLFKVQVDTAPKVLIAPDRDSLIMVNLYVVVKTVDPGAATGASLTYTATQADGTPLTGTVTVDLTTGGVASLTFTKALMAEAPVVYSFTGGAPYGGASYDLFASALRLA